jgi:glycosyltransferase involved in cell wall biosynthesis
MRLVVFFSRGMSLDGWRRAGILERELALYRALRPHLEHLAFLTYGGEEEGALAPQLPGVEILANTWKLQSNLYSVGASFLHRRALRRATIFKTNQLNGAWCAVIAKRLFGKKLVVRCGFLWSDFVARLHPGAWRQTAARRLERRACRAADAVIVAAESDRDAIVRRYGVAPDRVQVIPNYVDISVFRPMPEVPREPGRIVFVGRLEDQKNVLALVDAVLGLADASLTIVGDGPLLDQLRARAERRPGAVTFLGARPHAELPALLNRSTLLVLPSHYEGHPKAVVEAMACSLPVVGARVPGIREIVVHGETGFLCGTSAEEIRAALRAVLDDGELRERIAAGGLRYVRSCCSLQSATERELAILQSLSAG